MFKKSNIKSKIIGLGVGSIIIPTIIILSFVLITGNKMAEVVNTEIYKMGDDSITDISTGIYETIDQAVDSTIKQICISTVKNAKEKIQYYYDQFRNGLITEDEAKKQASDFLLSKKIGESGYIYVLSPDGIVLLHPVNNLLGKDLTGHAFIRDQIASKSSGYFEYMWKNPGEAEERAKSLAQEYFEPWGWLISASGYKNELALHAKKEIEPSIRKIVLEKKISQSQ